MRVAFNATPLLAPLTGIGNYIVELAAALGSDIDAYAFYGLRWRHERPTPPAGRAGAASLTALQRLKPLLPLRGALRALRPHLGFRSGLRDLAIDVYHEPNYVPLAYDVPVVVTIHDLSWVRYPDAHPRDRVKWLERGVPVALERASAVLVDSEFVRREVMETFGVDTARIHTAHLGVSPDFHARNADATRETLQPLGLAHGGYVLTVGTMEPRKNLEHAVAAHRLLAGALRARFPLVVAGASGWGAKRTLTEIRASSDEHVRYLGSVPRSALLDLYAAAALFVFPSRYEGFGLPPLEAMASGVPVLVSNRASLPEVTGDVGELLDPDDVPGTARTLQALLDDAQRRADMSRRGMARAAAFTWNGCAQATVAAYERAMGIGTGTARRGAAPAATRLS